MNSFYKSRLPNKKKAEMLLQAFIKSAYYQTCNVITKCVSTVRKGVMSYEETSLLMSLRFSKQHLTTISLKKCYLTLEDRISHRRHSSHINTSSC